MGANIIQYLEGRTDGLFIKSIDDKNWEVWPIPRMLKENCNLILTGWKMVVRGTRGLLIEKIVRF